MVFKIINKREILKGKFTNLWETIFLDKEGNEQTWRWLEKKDVVMVFAITKDNNVVLIKNFRVPLEKYVIELPAGLLDKKGENTEEAIRRELLEETGYAVEALHALPPDPFSASISNNIRHCYIATGAIKASDAHGDAAEDITVMEVPPHELVDFYLNGTELFNMHILALYQVALSKGLIK